MQRFRAIAAGRRGFARHAAALLAAAGLAAAASAESGAGDPATGPGPPSEERRVVCTPFGCRALPRTSWTWWVAFGAAGGGAAWLGRRLRAAGSGSA
jgi:hypothetical protein